MKLLLSLLITLVFVAIATGEPITEKDVAKDSLVSPSEANDLHSAATTPTWSWEIPSLHYVLAADNEIPNLVTPKPISEEPKEVKKEETEDLNHIKTDVMENFGDATDVGREDIKLKLKLRLKGSPSSEEERGSGEDESEGDEDRSSDEDGSEGDEGRESEEGLELSKRKKMKYKPVNVKSSTDNISEEPKLTEERLRMTPRTLRSVRDPSRLRFRSGFSKKPFGDTEKPDLDMLFAKLSIAQHMLEALDDYMVDMENKKLVEATSGHPQLAKRLELITQLSQRLHNFLLVAIDKLNSQIESLKEDASLGSPGLRFGRMGSRNRGVRNIQGSQGRFI